MTEHDEEHLAQLENDLVAEIGETIECQIPQFDGAAGLDARLTLSTRGAIRRILPAIVARLTADEIRSQMIGGVKAEHPEWSDDAARVFVEDKSNAIAKEMTRAALRRLDLRDPLQITIDSELSASIAATWHNYGLGLPVVDAEGFAIETSTLKALRREAERIERIRTKAWPKIVEPDPRGRRKKPILMLDLQINRLLRREYDRIEQHRKEHGKPTASEFVIPDLASSLRRLAKDQPEQIRDRLVAMAQDELKLPGKLRARLWPKRERSSRRK